MVTTSTKSGGRYHSISRSSELLACARTALRLQHEEFQQQQQQQQHSNGVLNPPASCNLLSLDQLTLYQEDSHSNGNTYQPQHIQTSQNTLRHFESLTPTEQTLAECQQLLAALDTLLTRLGSLVKRRGHTNDPTSDIEDCMSRFQTCITELATGIEGLRASSSAQTTSWRAKGKNHYQLHYRVVAQVLESYAKVRTERFQACMNTRGEVLKAQAARRGRSDQTTRAKPSSVGGSKQMESPLFAMTHLPKTAVAPLFANRGIRNPNTVTVSTKNGTANVAAKSSSPANIRDGKRIGPSSGNNVAWKPNGYNYYDTSTTPTGMRKRSGHAASNAASNYTNISGGYGAAYNPYQQQQQQQQDSTPDPSTTTTTTQQIQTRRANRATQSRLESAISAERTIAEIGSLFSKMTNIVSMQGEQISRIEDDVEASMGLVDAGAEEISKVYGLQKGNRGLILKTFGLLIALLFFMKLY
eukprot:CAMPEP_0194366716 /NCGR_PEP_ID=MMETSP0174-20130528/14781_1 /TAXON_ID=216777 /ORGANISM="Proboscia alata, Strain PI-D3" /LENGTH=470 /DNA_ID=CAMNT_0039142081 /DNA_START=70 /DNA_END=1482 /DNA_ORIENTATION=-